MKKVPVSILISQSLDYALSHLCKRKWLEGEFQAEFESFNGSSDNSPTFQWNQGGMFITNCGLHLRVSPFASRDKSMSYESYVLLFEFLGERVTSMHGATPLIAAMRSYIAYFNPSGVDIPDEYLPNYVANDVKSSVNFSVNGGIATFENGETVDIVSIQKSLYHLFQDRGDPGFHEAMLSLSKMSGVMIGTYGEFSYD